MRLLMDAEMLLGSVPVFLYLLNVLVFSFGGVWVVTPKVAGNSAVMAGRCMKKYDASPSGAVCAARQLTKLIA